MRIRVILLAGFIAFFCLSQAHSAELSQSVRFSPQDLTFSQSAGFEVVYLRGCDITSQVGEPQLPVKQVSVLLPSGSQVEEVIVKSGEGELLPGEYQILPAQPPRILSMMQEPIPFVRPLPRAYRQSAEYPGRLVEHTGAGFLGGYQLVNILVYPVQYFPSQKKLKFYSQVEFTIRYSAGRKEPVPIRQRSAAGRQVFQTILKRATVNSDPSRLEFIPREIRRSFVPPGDFEYVIITDTGFVSTFQSLADWKTEKGVPAKIVTTQWIYSQYSGYDNAEKVRNFIKDVYQNWGTLWILLGGDTNVVPDRAAWAMDCEAGMSPDENEIRCDLYFSDLDGSWDADGDHIYGEVEDSVDLYPDVFVGRASCSNVTKAQALVNKLLIYEKNPPADYTTKMLFLAEILWSNPYTNSGLSKDMIDELYVPPQFDPITKLYEDLGNENYTSAMAALNDGQNIINHDGHCWWTVMGVGNGSLYRSDMDALHNGPRNSILYSIGCWPAAIDYDCLAEHFINNPNGGGVAFIGNSRYGWGSPGNPKYGYSDRFDQQFYASLFARDIYRIGATVADMKSFYAPFSRQENVYRWCQYQVVLLGDPEMPIWTDTPQTLLVHHPDTIVSGSNQFPVTVYSGSGEMEPVEGALVCLMKGDEVYQRGLTDQQGQILLDIEPSSAGDLYATVTAHNFLYHTGAATVLAAGGCVLYEEHSIDDATTGNGDGLPNPGETIDMSVTLKNWGTEVEYNVYAILHSTGDPYVTLIDSLQDFGIMNPGQSAVSLEPYSFSIGSDCPNNHVVYFDLQINEGYGFSWSSMISITVVTPDLFYYSYSVDDASGGNGNGIPEPLETFDLRVYAKNQGVELATSVTGSLSTPSPYLYFPSSSADFGDVGFGEVRGATFEDIQLLSGCPSNDFPYLHLQAETGEGYVFQDSFVLSIGEWGLEDDMESGTGEWTHWGTWDSWHLTDYRKHSGDYSWYNGLEGFWYFRDNTHSWLQSSPVILGPESCLSFWMWYDVTNYGVDGIHLELFYEGTGVRDTIDFIGTGGALDSLLNTGNDWLEYTYDLSYIPPGTGIRIGFVFSSDAQYSYDGEGFYIDDVRVGPSRGAWIAGDVTGDLVVDVADVIFLVNYLYKFGPAPDPPERGDVNQDSEVTLADIVYLINYLYRAGPPPL
ncbi:MAG: C25 family cysteine peptidase [Candidatus Zixiibacteriota bacterium]